VANAKLYTVKAALAIYPVIILEIIGEVIESDFLFFRVNDAAS
jgi:hypothetical protein